MSDKLSNLPPEVVLLILSHLPIYSLLSFGATSRTNHAYHAMSLTQLHLAVFPKRIQSVIAWLNCDPSFPTQAIFRSPGCTSIQRHPQYISVELQKGTNGDQRRHHRSRKTSSGDRMIASSEEEPRTSRQTIRDQNAVLSNILNRYGSSLVTLEFLAYDLDEYAAHALGSNCQRKLRNLALHFEHTHVRDHTLPRDFWRKPAPGSTAWNSLIGLGGRNCGLRGLESLTLERAGITPWQLRKLVKRNRNLRELRLRTCSAVQPEFLEWLGTLGKRGKMVSYDDEAVAERGSMLEVLWVENCAGVSSRGASVEEIGGTVLANLGELEWVSRLRFLKSLSFRQCKNVNPDIVDKLNKSVWNIPDFVIPYPLLSAKPDANVIEVDPDFK
ncbi:hypothetical protein FQN54_008298 [Arachnomyces sp. PD_36]|nr:hypothetical protein FQN54_008298 [Arachnomyces sp. PD_36]